MGWTTFQHSNIPTHRPRFCVKYSYLLEIKYIPKKEGKSQKELEKNIRLLREEAEDQLKRYSGDDKFKKTIGQTTVVKLVLIFCGNELEYIGKAK